MHHGFKVLNFWTFNLSNFKGETGSWKEELSDEVKSMYDAKYS